MKKTLLILIMLIAIVTLYSSPIAEASSTESEENVIVNTLQKQVNK